ncbi:uncharacterized protein LOC143032134 [Oratosquilla oratoria]|uniref:uncharacterized protein LOC143032134 n=1 Tax=Oratosquilla oratoria TaxID=337810 RepID=UPI003F77270D
MSHNSRIPKMEPSEMVRVTTEAVVRVLHYSHDPEFIAEILDLLQVDDIECAETRLNTHLWFLLNHFLNVDIPSGLLGSTDPYLLNDHPQAMLRIPGDMEEDILATGNDAFRGAEGHECSSQKDNAWTLEEKRIKASCSQRLLKEAIGLNKGKEQYGAKWNAVASGRGEITICNELSSQSEDGPRSRSPSRYDVSSYFPSCSQHQEYVAHSNTCQAETLSSLSLTGALSDVYPAFTCMEDTGSGENRLYVPSNFSQNLYEDELMRENQAGSDSSLSIGMLEEAWGKIPPIEIEDFSVSDPSVHLSQSDYLSESQLLNDLQEWNEVISPPGDAESVGGGSVAQVVSDKVEGEVHKALVNRTLSVLSRNLACPADSSPQKGWVDSPSTLLPQGPEMDLHHRLPSPGVTTAVMDDTRVHKESSEGAAPLASLPVNEEDPFDTRQYGRYGSPHRSRSPNERKNAAPVVEIGGAETYEEEDDLGDVTSVAAVNKSSDSSRQEGPKKKGLPATPNDTRITSDVVSSALPFSSTSKETGPESLLHHSEEDEEEKKCPSSSLNGDNNGSGRCRTETLRDETQRRARGLQRSGEAEDDGWKGFDSSVWPETRTSHGKRLPGFLVSDQPQAAASVASDSTSSDAEELLDNLLPGDFIPPGGFNGGEDQATCSVRKRKCRHLWYQKDDQDKCPGEHLLYHATWSDFDPIELNTDEEDQVTFPVRKHNLRYPREVSPAEEQLSPVPWNDLNPLELPTSGEDRVISLVRKHNLRYNLNREDDDEEFSSKELLEPFLKREFDPPGPGGAHQVTAPAPKHNLRYHRYQDDDLKSPADELLGPLPQGDTGNFRVITDEVDLVNSPVHQQSLRNRVNDQEDPDTRRGYKLKDSQEDPQGRHADPEEPCIWGTEASSESELLFYQEPCQWNRGLGHKEMTVEVEKEKGGKGEEGMCLGNLKGSMPDDIGGSERVEEEQGNGDDDLHEFQYHLQDFIW